MTSSARRTRKAGNSPAKVTGKAAKVVSHAQNVVAKAAADHGNASVGKNPTTKTGSHAANSAKAANHGKAVRVVSHAGNNAKAVIMAHVLVAAKAGAITSPALTAGSSNVHRKGNGASRNREEKDRSNNQAAALIPKAAKVHPLHRDKVAAEAVTVDPGTGPGSNSSRKKKTKV